MVQPGRQLRAQFEMLGTEFFRDLLQRLQMRRGIAVPKRVIGDEINAALKSPDMKKQLDGMGADPTFLAPVAFRGFLVKEDDRWTRAFKASGLKAQ